MALIGSNHKSQLAGRLERQGRGQTARQPCASPFLRDSFETYDEGFHVDLNHFYSGLNAAAMLTVLTSLAAEACRTSGPRCFVSDEEARAELVELKDRHRSYSPR